ncbi:MAG: hypothetical protein KAX10_06720 [Candidatus Lokiarchaeota archaeon]|nr:hypothetical protein [Candidatus Lokiarchaeota archaeon]
MSGYERIVTFFNNMEENHPVSIKEIEDNTNLSWTYIKKVLFKIEDNYHLNFRKSGGTWIVWKEPGHLRRRIKDSCSQYLK